MNAPRLPAAWSLAAGLFIGCLVATATPIPIAEAVAVLAVAGSGVLLVTGRRRRRGRWSGLVMVAAAVGLLRGGAALPPPVPDDAARSPGSVKVVVLGAPEGPVRGLGAGDRRRDDAVFPAELTEGVGRVRVRVAVENGEAPPDLRPGDRLEILGRFEPPRRATNPGERDRRAAARRRGVVLEARVPDAAALRVRGPPALGGRLGIARAAHRVRKTLLRRLDAACARHPTARELLPCLLLGERSSVSRELRDDFRTAGLAHLLVVSGLHLVLLSGTAATIATRALRGGSRPVAQRRTIVALTLLVAGGYALACRLATPVTRAAVFVGVACLARAGGRRTTFADHAAVAAVAILAADPGQAAEPGFQMSFSAVLGLAGLAPRLHEALFARLEPMRRFPEAWPRWQRLLVLGGARALSATLGAQLGTAPVVAMTFGRLHPFAPFANLIAIPLVAALLPPAALLACCGSGMGAVIGAPVDVLCRLLVVVARVTAALPGAVVETGPVPVAAALTAAAVLVVGAAVRPWRARHLLVPVAAIAILSLWPTGSAAPTAGPDAIVLDVGHGLAVVVRDGAGTAVLVDAGGLTPGAAERVIVDGLRALHVRRLAALVLSHEDADHCGAAAGVLARVDVDEVLVPWGFGGDPAARRALAGARDAGVPVRHLGRGDTWSRGHVTLRALHPPQDAPGPAGNEGSLVLHAVVRASPRDLTLLLPGDLEGLPLAALAADRTLPRADVLLLPHHGRGDVGPQIALARRLGATTWIASTPATAPTDVPTARSTGHEGALRVVPGGHVQRCAPR